MAGGCALSRFGVLMFMTLGAVGCGGPEGAGSIDIGRAKAVAAERGIPEHKSAPPGRSKSANRGAVPRPTEALPKGGR